MAEQEVVLKIVGLDKSFGITHANCNIDLELKKGEIRGLAGENGSGKSTLLSQVAGLVPIDKGELFVKGEPYMPKSPIEAQKRKIAMIVQELGMVGELPAGVNIFLGDMDKFSKGPFVSLSRFYKEAEEIREKWELPPLNFRRKASSLNVESRKMMELVRALAVNPDILILDEVTQSLSQDNREVIYKLIKRFKAEGRSVLMISHDLDETLQVTDTISVLRDGNLIGTVVSAETSETELRRMMVGRDLSGSYYREDQKETHGDEVALKLENVSSEGGVRDVNVQVHEGEILAFCGLSDSGIHDIGQIAYGLMKPTGGQVILMTDQGEEVIKNPIQSLKRQMAYVPKDRDGEAMMMKSTILQNTVLPSAENLEGKFGYLDSASLRAVAEDAKNQFLIKCTGVTQKVNALSGGNKQKVNLGRWLVKDLKVLIVDCPTRGVDVGVKAYIYECLRKAKEKGIATLMITDELSEAMGMADRIVVMKNGVTEKIISRNEGFDEESIIEGMI